MAQLERLTGELEYTYKGGGLQDAIKDMGRLGDQSGAMSKKGLASFASLKGVGMAAGAALTGVGIAGVAAAGGIAYAVGPAMDFEASLSGIKAVSGATAEEMELVSKKALQIGADTSFSAQEAANAIQELIKAGVSVEGVLTGAADATVALAAAGEVDMPTAAAIASAAMNNFGVAASELPQIADLIAGAANASAISVEDFGYSLQASGAVASLVGFDFDDLAVAITAMGNAGIKGSDAGTSLKTFMTGLIPMTDKQVGLFKELGIVTEEGGNAFFDAEGKVKGMADVAGILSGALEGMSEEQRLANLEIMFGSDAIRAAAIIADNGADGINNLATQMGKISAADVAKERLNNLTGSVEAFWGSLETLRIKAGLALTPVFKAITDFGTNALNQLGPVLDQITPRIEAAFADFDIEAFMSGDMGGLGDTFAPLIDSLIDLKDAVLDIDFASLATTAKDAAPAVIDLAAGLVDLITFLVEHKDLVLTVVAAWAGFSALMPLVPIITGLAAAFGTLAAAFSTGGLGAALTALVGLLGGPVTVALAVVAGLIAAYTTDFMGFGTFVDSVISRVTDALSSLWSLVTGDWANVDLGAIVDLVLQPVFGIPAKIVEYLTGTNPLDAITGWFSDIELPEIGIGSLFGGGDTGVPPEVEAQIASITMTMKEGLAEAAQGLSDLGLPPELAQRVADLGANLENLDTATVASELSDIVAEADKLGLPDDAVSDFAALAGGAINARTAMDELAAAGAPDLTWMERLQQPIELPDMSGWMEQLQKPIDPPDFGAMFADIEWPELDLSGLFEGVDLPELPELNLPDMPDIDLSPLTDPFTNAWSDIEGGIDTAWVDFQAAVQRGQDAIYDYLLDIWMQIPEDIRADLVLIAEHIREQFEQYRADIEEKLQEAKDSIQTWLADVKRQWDTWLADTVQTARDAWADVKNAIMEPLLEAKADLSSAWASVQAEAAAAWGRVQQVIQDAVARALAVLSDVRAQIEQRARDAWAGVVSAAQTALGPLVAAVTERVNAAIAYLSGIRDTVAGKAREAWDGFVTATRSALAKLKDAVITPIRTALDGLRTMVRDAATRAGEIGTGIVDGIKTAFNAKVASLKTSIWDAIRGLLDWVKGKLGIDTGITAPGAGGGGGGGGGGGMGMNTSGIGALAADPFASLVTGDPDRAIAAAIAAMDDLADAYDRLRQTAADVNGRDLLAAPIRRMNDALTAFFDGGAAGSLSDLLRMMGEGGFSPDQASLLERLGFSERSFEEIQRAIEALAGEPEKQARLWGDFIDGLMSGWDEFYRAQRAPLEEQKRALELLKKAAERDPNRVGTEYDPQIEAVQALLDAWEAKNDAIQRGLDGQDMTLDGILAAYKRIKDAVEATNDAAEEGLKALEAARKMAEDAIKRRQDSALGAEEGAHDEAMAMLDAEARARERAHKARMRAMDEQQKALEADVAAALADEERLHAARMAAITAQVDARDAELDAEETLLDKAKMYLDLLGAGGTLTDPQKSLLRSLGIDPDTVAATNAGLAETTRRMDQMKRIMDQLPDERGRVRQGGGEIRTEAGKQIGDKGATFTEADKDALQAALDSGAISEKDRRVVEVFLAGGVVQAQRLRQILGPLIEKDAAAIEAAGKQVDLADDLLGRREAQLKIDRQIAEEARAALAGQITAEEAAHDAFVKAQEDRVTAFELRRDAIEEAYDAEREAIAEAKAAEEDRHDARMKAIRDEYALQLLTLGKTDAEIAAILDEMARRQATITAEAQARFEKIMRDAEAIRAANAAGPIPVMGGDPNRQAKRQGGGGVRPGDHPIVLPPLGPDYMNTFDQTNAGLATFGDLMRDVSAAMATAAPFLPAIAAGAGGGAGGGGGNRDLTNYGLITVGDQGAGNREFAAALMEFLGL